MGLSESPIQEPRNAQPFGWSLFNEKDQLVNENGEDSANTFGKSAVLDRWGSLVSSKVRAEEFEVESEDSKLSPTQSNPTKRFTDFLHGACPASSDGETSCDNISLSKQAPLNYLFNKLSNGNAAYSRHQQKPSVSSTVTSSSFLSSKSPSASSNTSGGGKMSPAHGVIGVGKTTSVRNEPCKLNLVEKRSRNLMITSLSEEPISEVLLEHFLREIGELEFCMKVPFSPRMIIASFQTEESAKDAMARLNSMNGAFEANIIDKAAFDEFSSFIRSNAPKKKANPIGRELTQKLTTRLGSDFSDSDGGYESEPLSPASQLLRRNNMGLDLSISPFLSHFWGNGPVSSDSKSEGAASPKVAPSNGASYATSSVKTTAPSMLLPVPVTDGLPRAHFYSASIPPINNNCPSVNNYTTPSIESSLESLKISNSGAPIIFPIATSKRGGKKPVQGRLREIRRKLEGFATAAEVEALFLECLPFATELSVDYVGNIVMQKFVERCSDEQRLQLIERISPEFASIGIHKNGTWVAQRIVDYARTHEQMAAVAAALAPYTVSLMSDSFGNYVLQGCLRLGPKYNQFIFDAIQSETLTLCTARFGSRGSRTCLESLFTTAEQRRQVAVALMEHGPVLAQDVNGVIMLNWLLDASGLLGRYRVLAPILVPHLESLCKNKLGSSIVLKIVNQQLEPDARSTVLQVLFDPRSDLLSKVLSDQYQGVVTIQKILSCPSLTESEQAFVNEGVKSFAVSPVYQNPQHVSNF